MPGGMLRYGIPQYRLPKVEVLEAEYEGIVRLGGRFVSNQGLGRDFTLDDLQNQGYDAVCIAIGCYDTNKLGIPGEDADGVLDGLDYLRTATLGLEYPGHKGSRVVVIGGGFTSMDCTRTSVRQGAAEVTLVYRRDMKDMPAADEVHEAIEEGARRDLPGGPGQDRDGQEEQGHGRRVHPEEARRAGRIRPAAAGALAGHRVHDPLRSRAARDRPGPRPVVDRAGLGRPHGQQAAPPDGRRRDVRDRAARRVRHGRRPDRVGHGRPGRRRGPAIGLRHRRLPQGTRPRRDPHAPDAGRAAARVPLDRAVHERDQGAALSHEEDGGGGPEPELRRVRDPVHPGRRDRGVDALPAVHVRGDRVLRPAAPRDRIPDDAARRSSRSTTPGAGYRSVTENRFTGYNHDYIRDDSHAFILREPSRCIDCGRCAQVCSEVVGAACYDFMRIGFDTLVTTPLDMSLNDTPCVSCGRCAETCPTGALMPKPRVLQKYDVDESRCILCGICVDACPYDALRDSTEIELAHESRSDPMIDLLSYSAVNQETEVTYIRRETRLGGAGDGRAAG